MRTDLLRKYRLHCCVIERRFGSQYQEEKLLRHCEIPLFPFLELNRLRNFHVTKHPTYSPNIHMFEAVPKSSSPTENPGARFFVRIITNVNEPLTSEVGLFEQER